MSRKPTGSKSYGSIPHLPSSRMGPADRACPPGMQRIATKTLRNKHDQVIVQEKLDGSNVGVAKVGNEIVALQRAGYPARTSPYQQHVFFHHWVQQNQSRFSELLEEGERVCGEWLLQAHGTRYELFHEPFVPFDIMIGVTRLPYEKFRTRVEKLGFTIPHCVHMGAPISVEAALKSLGEFGKHGAIDPIEGAVWRVETYRLMDRKRQGIRNLEVDFVVKYVKPEKLDGKYLPALSGLPEVWNLDPSSLCSAD